MAVSSPAFAALRNRDRFTVRHQVGQDLPCFVVVDDSSHRQLHVDGFPPAAGAIGSASSFAIFCLVVPLITEVKERCETVGRGKDHTPAIASVPSVRAATGDEHLPSEAAAAVSAATGLHGDTNFIDEHRILSC